MLKNLLKKADEFELQLSNSRWLLPICFVISFIGVLAAWLICYSVFALDTTKDNDRVIYSYHNEVYELTAGMK